MKPFCDTNVLVYAVTAEDPRKQHLARELLARHPGQAMTLSTQVLGEAYRVLTLRKRWPAHEALATVRVLATLRVVTASTETLLRGLELAGQHQVSSWDAVIVQTAIEAGCDTLFSEDLQSGRRFGTLEVLNPFDLRAHEAGPPRAVLAPPARSARSAGKSSKTRPSSRAR